LKKAALHSGLLVLFYITTWLSSCKPKYICPAYQSAFYLDQKAAALEFTPFDKDTLPKMENLIRKNDVLLIVRLGKKKIENRMAVIPMITIYREPDSLLASSDSLGSDSLAADDMMPDEDSDLIQDSSDTSNEEQQDDEVNSEEDASEEEKQEKKQSKKNRNQDDKDPEISDPSIKFDFEETFEDSASAEEYQDMIPEEDNDIPRPRNDEKRKAIQDPDADKPKEEEEEATEDGKF
jgi:hypothetical protein